MEACVSVQHALSGEDIASLALPATGTVFELKLRLEDTVGVPAEYQTLLRPDEVVPLCDASTLLEAGLSPESAVLFAPERGPKHADRELWETCMGCLCNFGEPGAGNPNCSDLAEKICGCQVDAGTNPRILKVKYLVRHLSDNDQFKQILFERTVLEGGSESYTEAAKHLAEDVRINVNAVGCPCAGFPTLLGVALEKGHLDMCRMLIDSGRLQIPSDTMYQDLQEQRENDDEILGLLGTLPDSSDSRARAIHILDHNESSFGDICKFIKGQGLQKHPWCKKYLHSYQKAIEYVFEDLLRSDASDPYDAPVRSGHFTRKQDASLPGHGAKSIKNRSKAGQVEGEAEHSRPAPRVKSTKRTGHDRSVLSAHSKFEGGET